MEAIALLLAALTALGAWWWLRHRRASPSAEDRLAQICLGDRAQAERLVDVEMARAPGITRIEAIERAIGRHHRDNR